MTEEQNLENQGNADNTALPNVDAQQQNNNAATAPENKPVPTFTRDQLAVASNNAKQAGIEQGKREALKELQNKPVVEQQNIPPVQQPSPVQQSDNKQEQPANISQDDINSMVDNAVKQRAAEMEYNRIYKEIEQKTTEAASNTEKYPDFWQAMNGLGFNPNPQSYQSDPLAAAKETVVMWANNLPNTADVLYTLGKDTDKYLNILNTAQSLSPEKAHAKLQALSESLARNEKASQQNFPSEPLGQIKAATTGGDNGSFTIKDVKAHPSMKA
jgi:hypothetical protein